MLELAMLEAHNLYMEYDEEVPRTCWKPLKRGSGAWNRGNR
ncbi:MAG: hypothetical protein ACLVJ6_00705 [Merdibacter sp.]